MEEYNDKPVNESDKIENSRPEEQPKPNIEPETIEPLSKNQKKSKKKLYIIIAIVFILLLSAATFYYYIYYNNNQSKKSIVKTKDVITTTKKEIVKLDTDTDQQVIKFITPTTGEIWLDKPVAIEKQGFFRVEDPSYNSGESVTDYFKVGSRDNKTIILTSSPGFMSYGYGLFEQAADGTVTMINHPDSLAVYNKDYDDSTTTYLSPNVIVSNDIHYDSLSIPDQIKIDEKGSVVLSPMYPSLGSEYSAPKGNELVGNVETLIRQLGKSSLYKYESTNAETKLVSVSYFIKTPLNTSITLGYEPLDLNMSSYKWQTGFSGPSDTLKAITYGCGLASGTVTRSNSITENDVQIVGKSGKGLVVYGFKDSKNELLQKAYTEFKDFYSMDTTGAYQSMTIDDFLKQHGIVIYKDVNGQWLVYVNSSLAPAGGCAKPVVYLYPEKEELVSVKVGADVKISDPYYNPATGWTAVAKPNGQLTVNGVNYSSLFWEGPGYGQYPQITEGTIVKQKDVISTIKNQLTQQGLKNNEINDFVDYWRGNLPTDSYVRLTWFNTSQMEKLAPLYVTPKPDTTIRVFLDASGMKKPISIPKQNLKSIPRNGFTVVEWGGLSNHKLY